MLSKSLPSESALDKLPFTHYDYKYVSEISALELNATFDRVTSSVACKLITINTINKLIFCNAVC